MSRALLSAIKKGDLEKVTKILESGVDPNINAGRGVIWPDIPLIVAAERNDADIVRTLLDHDADADIRDWLAWTPLHRVAQDKNGRQVIALLVSCGATVNVRDASGDTPLHLACRWNRTESVRALIENGADVNARNGRGRTPREKAARNKLYEIVRLLDEFAASHAENEANGSRCQLRNDSEKRFTGDEGTKGETTNVSTASPASSELPSENPLPQPKPRAKSRIPPESEPPVWREPKPSPQALHTCAPISPPAISAQSPGGVSQVEESTPWQMQAPAVTPTIFNGDLDYPCNKEIAVPCRPAPAPPLTNVKGSDDVCIVTAVTPGRPAPALPIKPRPMTPISESSQMLAGDQDAVVRRPPLAPKPRVLTFLHKNT